jgi:hypothetical protein
MKILIGRHRRVWEGIIEENNEMCDMKSGTGVWGYVT